MIYGYIRVSTDKQIVENQRFEIMNFCDKNGLVIDDWIEEAISGTKAYLLISKSQMLLAAAYSAAISPFGSI